MTTAPISKPLLALLLGTAALSVVLLLRPEADNTAEADLVADRPPLVQQATAQVLGETPWVRKLPAIAHPNTATAASLAKAVVPPSPPVAFIPVAPPLPPVPTVPTPPYSYIGRLLQDHQTVVFFENGEDHFAVAIGDTLDDQWRVEAVSTDGVQLRYLPMNALKLLALNH